MNMRLDPAYRAESIAALKNNPRQAEYEANATTRADANFDFFPEMLVPGARVLDVGCGSGRLTLRLAAQAQSVYGLDLSPVLLSLAQDRQRAQRVKNVTWVLGDAHRLPFASASFDYIASGWVLRLTSMPLVLTQLRAIVKPGGRIAIRDLAHTNPNPTFRLTAHLIRTVKKMPTHLRLYGVKTAFHIAQARLAPSLVFHLSQERDWSLSSALNSYQNTLPKCEISRDGTDILVVWNKPA